MILQLLLQIVKPINIMINTNNINANKNKKTTYINNYHNILYYALQKIIHNMQSVIKIN